MLIQQTKERRIFDRHSQYSVNIRDGFGHSCQLRSDNIGPCSKNQIRSFIVCIIDTTQDMGNDFT